MLDYLLDNVKNLVGWRTKRNLIVFCVDDYGNVRLDSKSARHQLDREGQYATNRFDMFDALETRSDLETLFETLTSVRDITGSPAVFTPFVVPCNIDFEQMAADGYSQYKYELLPDTFGKQAARHGSAYSGAWSLWQEGIEKGLMAPEFHGREHFSVKILEEHLGQQDDVLRASMKTRSLISLPVTRYPSIKFTAAFSYWDETEVLAFPEILTTGTDAFEKVFGFRASAFTPPAQQFPTCLEPTLPDLGIRILHKPFFSAEHHGKGKYAKSFYATRYNKNTGLVNLVRNVIFEPCYSPEVDSVNLALRQIEAAFRWNRPAIISSHRVNFAGHIDEKNRKTGVCALQSLLRKIMRSWPDTEFVSAAALGSLIDAGRQLNAYSGPHDPVV